MCNFLWLFMNHDRKSSVPQILQKQHTRLAGPWAKVLKCPMSPYTRNASSWHHCLPCEQSDWSKSASFRKLARITLKASTEAYGIDVSGSKYFACRPVTGQVELSTGYSFRRDGKKRRYTVSSLNVINVLEHFLSVAEFGWIVFTCSELHSHTANTNY